MSGEEVWRRTSATGDEGRDEGKTAPGCQLWNQGETVRGRGEDLQLDFLYTQQQWPLVPREISLGIKHLAFPPSESIVGFSTSPASPFCNDLNIIIILS